MVNVTMGQILSFNGVINRISAIKIPMSGAYKLSKIKTGLTTELNFYREKFNEILGEYGVKEEDGRLKLLFDKDVNGNDIPGTERIQIIDGKEEECNRVLQELQDVEVEFNNYGLKIDDFGQIDMTIEDMDAIAPFIGE